MSYNSRIPFVVRNGKETYVDSQGNDHVYYSDYGTSPQYEQSIEEKIDKKKAMADDIND